MTARIGTSSVSSTSSKGISNFLLLTLLRISPEIGVPLCFANLIAFIVALNVGLSGVVTIKSSSDARITASVSSSSVGAESTRIMS